MKAKHSVKWAVAATLVGAAVLGNPLIGYAMGGGMGGGGMLGGFGHGMMDGFRGGMNGDYGQEPNRRYREDRNRGSSGLDSRIGRRFAQTCAQCHPLPDPRQHTAQQWPGVVARMEQHMRERNLRVPDDDAIEEIEAFLGREARDRR